MGPCAVLGSIRVRALSPRRIVAFAGQLRTPSSVLGDLAATGDVLAV
jgi:hypothetical protein